MKTIMNKLCSLVFGLCLLTGLNAQINSLPYQQNFDDLFVPDLPLEWASVISAPGALVETSVINAFSIPNSLRMYRGGAVQGEVILVLPEVPPEYEITSLRLRLMARSLSTSANLSIGVMSDPTNAATFIETTNPFLSLAWQEQILSFAGYSGDGHFPAIKLNYGSIFIDNLNLEYSPQNDLAALGIEGNPTPTLGVQVNYTVNIRNYGLTPQAGYEVKLYKDAGIEVASVEGPSLESGETDVATLQWTATQAGPSLLYAKVFLALDEFSYNDSTQPMSIHVIDAVTDPPLPPANYPERIPLDMFYQNSVCQYLLFPIEYGGAGGYITSLVLLNNFNSNLTDIPVKIWLAATDLDNLDGGWIPYQEFTMVFNGTQDFPSAQNSIYFYLDRPFLFPSNQNLAVMFQRIWEPEYYSSLDKFQCMQLTTTRCRRAFSDTIIYDPVNLAQPGTASTFVPHTRLLFTASLNGAVSGTVTNNAGLPLNNVQVQLGSHTTLTAPNGSFSISDLPPGDYDISYFLSGYYPFSQGITINPMQNTIADATLFTQIGFLFGTVTDESYLPLEGATVTVNGLDASTDENGLYKFAIPVGLYDILVSKQGYQSQVYNAAEVFPDEFAMVDFILVEGTTVQDDNTPVLDSKLLSNHPNPFWGKTMLSYQIKASEEVSFRIYNLRGQLIRTLHDHRSAAGTHQISWDGRDSSGKAVPSGIYLCRMTAGSYSGTVKMLKLEDR
ncbi:MAG: carboxypeptidase regulatory-like domain-containing protein [Candidatus Cloacimonetes bacterium]|nr:carboxypeptidase regulatory-like domain-containing protein [Candidatus Cloacimonadota bacterium]